MSTDWDIANEFLDEVADRLTAEELVELLGLDVYDVIEFFQDRILESSAVKKALRGIY